MDRDTGVILFSAEREREVEVEGRGKREGETRQHRKGGTESERSIGSAYKSRNSLNNCQRADRNAWRLW